MNFVIRLIVNAIALIVVAYIIPGVHVTGIVGAVVAALILGIVNAILKPILVILSLPLEIITLGLFTFVINAILFYLVGHLGVGLIVDNFGAAFIGALLLSIVSFILSRVVTSTETRTIR
ncbi:MAG: phage holin family protein [Candidatus Velthaea sp.]